MAPLSSSLSLQGIGDSSRVLVMGIVNVTPDSFSDGGRFLNVDAAVEYALELVRAGADWIDIGAESTRPGHSAVSADEEWRRLEPVLEQLFERCDVPISVDTYKAEVAERAVRLGARGINDIWGGLTDPEILDVAAAHKCTYFWMHNRQEPTMANAVDVLLKEAQAGVESCLQHGIHKDKLWIDPGIGFGKTHPQNLLVLRELYRFCQLGFPVLLGTSRKSVIGNVLDVPVDRRLSGSLATALWGAKAGVSAVRVHDVEATAQALRMWRAMATAGEENPLGNGADE